MTIVADSGSTKTTWMEIDSGNKVVTEGLNPHFSTDTMVAETCRRVVDTLGTPQRLFFYGAGCGNSRQNHRMQQLISTVFDTVDVAVETDMLGACRAVSGGQASLVAILGTGSNACLYDGHHVKYQPTSTGYILGDFGSANHVGRMLLNGYLTHRMPGRLRHMFHDYYQMSDAQFIDAVYHQTHPNRFLASLAVFCTQHQGEDYCYSIIIDALSFWYFEVLKPLFYHKSYFPATTWDGTVNIVGGFAKAVEPMLNEQFQEGPMHLGTVIANPIDGLRKYHKTNKII